MRKILLMIALLMGSMSVGAQQGVAFTGSLDEAISKAKTEGKTVMIVSSTTWCGPCKTMEANIYPSETFINYAKEKLVFVKYLLDKNDPDKIIEKYNVSVYPTYILIGGDGVEIMRFVGGASDAQLFVKKIEEALNPENSFAAREKRFHEQPETALDYINFLKNECYLKEKADKLFSELFDSRSVAENFSKESLHYYFENITDCNSKVLRFMIDNEKEVSAVTGKDEYFEFLIMKGIRFVMSEIFNSRFNEDRFLKVLGEVNSLKYISSPYSRLISNNSQLVVDRNINKLIEVMSSNLKKIDSNSRMSMVLTMHFMAGADSYKYKYSLLNLYEKAAKYEKNEKNKSEYLDLISQLKRSNNSYMIF